MIIPLKDIENVDKERGWSLRYYGLVITVRGHEELFFAFTTAVARDDCAIHVLQSVESARYMDPSGTSSDDDFEAEAAEAERKYLQDARTDLEEDADVSRLKTLKSTYWFSAPKMLELILIQMPTCPPYSSTTRRPPF